MCEKYTSAGPELVKYQLQTINFETIKEIWTQNKYLM